MRPLLLTCRHLLLACSGATRPTTSGSQTGPVGMSEEIDDVFLRDDWGAPSEASSAVVRRLAAARNNAGLNALHLMMTNDDVVDDIILLFRFAKGSVEDVCASSSPTPPSPAAAPSCGPPSLPYSSATPPVAPSLMQRLRTPLTPAASSTPLFPPSVLSSSAPPPAEAPPQPPRRLLFILLL